MKRFLIAVVAVLALSFVVVDRHAVDNEVASINVGNGKNVVGELIDKLLETVGPAPVYAATRTSGGLLGKWSRVTFPGEQTVNTDVDVGIEYIIDNAAVNVTQAVKFAACPIVKVSSYYTNGYATYVGFDASSLLMTGRVIFPLPASGATSTQWGPTKGVLYDARLLRAYGVAANQKIFLDCLPEAVPQ